MKKSGIFWSYNTSFQYLFYLTWQVICRLDNTAKVIYDCSKWCQTLRHCYIYSIDDIILGENYVMLLRMPACVCIEQISGKLSLLKFLILSSISLIWVAIEPFLQCLHNIIMLLITLLFYYIIKNIFIILLLANYSF